MRQAPGWVFFVFGLLGMALILPVMIAFPFNRTIFPVLIIASTAILFIGIVLLAATQDKFPEKRIESIDRAFPCPVCKKDVFSWGKVPSARIRLRVGTGQLVWARVCQNCGNVQQFTKID